MLNPPLNERNDVEKRRMLHATQPSSPKQAFDHTSSPKYVDDKIDVEHPNSECVREEARWNS